MSIKSRLKQGIRSRLGGSIQPAFNEETKTSDLYEEYICREQERSPDCKRVIIAVECKHYESELPLDLARSFIGLAAELQVEGDCYFVSNISSASVAKILASRRLKWEHNITPGFSNDINRLRYAFQSNFKDFHARYRI